MSLDQAARGLRSTVWIRLLACSAVVVGAFVWEGCAGKAGAVNADGGDQDAGEGLDAGSDAGALPPSPFGYDVRPVSSTCVVPPRPMLAAPVMLSRVFANLTFNAPVLALQAPGDDTRWYVVERAGTVRTFTTAASSDAEVTDFITVTVNASGEGGLLGMAFAPDFATSRAVYLSYTRPAAVANYGTNMRSTLARVTSANGIVADGPPVVLFDVGQPFTNHDGGNIQFGPDGFLYLGLGDGGSGDDPLEAGQDVTTPLAKMLRFDVSDTSSATYAIPADNPFATAPGSRKCSGFEPPLNPGAGPGPCQEIYAYGFRNPWRFSFDRESGELWVGDVGQNTWEEIDARVQRGGNYGWNLCEGKHLRGSTTQACTAAGTILPIVEHGRSEAQSITGGYVYRGSAIPSLRGTYLYGDFETGTVWAIVYDTMGQPSSQVIASVAPGLLASFAQSNDGEVYAVLFDGELQKFVPSGTTVPDTFPQTLSATGCVDPADATKPAAGLVPYELNSTLWSDGADKERYASLPATALIDVKPDGHWDFPIGTVLMKQFSLAGRRVETRLFMRHVDGLWAGYSYEWNDAGTDATLLPGAKTKTVGAQRWTFPSRSQCLQCHTVAAGWTLGPDTANLNRDVSYPATGRMAPQLDTWEHVGFFTAPLGAHPAPATSPADLTAPLEARTRSYLHTNCAHCHRPGGTGQGALDLRRDTTLHDTFTCNAVNTQGAVGGATLLIDPGQPAMSVLSQRLHATDATRMPAIAVSVPDPLGLTLVDDYIRSLTSCP